jgi:release factor glutamine methyltransferase
VTVLEVIQRSTEFLARKGVDSPRLQAELLLAHQLSLPRMKLYLNFERTLTPTESDAFRELIKRRGQREPLQQIVGSASFCGLEIAVNRHVLVPRPETELLAEQGWTFLNQLTAVVTVQVGTPRRGVRPTATTGTDANEPHKTRGRLGEASLPEQLPVVNAQPAAALEVGTGSGCLAIALAARCPAVHVLAIEISADALALARQNAARHSMAERIQFLESDGFAALAGDQRFDLIISNPPYISTAELDSLQPEVRDYEPRAALDGGADGLEHYRKLAAEAARFLKPAGKLMLELGDGHAEPARDIFQRQMWIVESILEDYTQRPRILIARRPD